MEAHIEENAVIATESPNSVAWYNRPISPDWVMALGFGMCALGFYTKLFWFTFGGFLLFMLGIQALPEKEEEGLHEKGEES